MIVECIAKSLSVTDKESMDCEIISEPVNMLTVGQKYLVLGMTFCYRSQLFGNTPLFQILDDGGRLRFFPSPLFSIVDNRPSSFWRVHIFDQLSFALWPEEFYTEYFHDDLSEGIEGAVQLFQKVVKELESEFPELGYKENEDEDI